MKCKNCGKAIYQGWHNKWFHTKTFSSICEMGTFATPTESEATQ